MTDRVEETIEVDGWAYENDTLAAMREGRDLGPDGMSGWRIFPHSAPVRAPGSRPRQVKVTVEVLADDPTPQRGDVWENCTGLRVLIAGPGPKGEFAGVVVGGSAGLTGQTALIRPDRLVARLDPGGEQ